MRAPEWDVEFLIVIQELERELSSHAAELPGTRAIGAFVKLQRVLRRRSSQRYISSVRQRIQLTRS